MSGHHTRLWDWFISIVSILFARLTSAIPLSAARVIGRGLGAVFYYAVPRVRRVSLANLDLAYGDTLSAQEKRRIARAAARNVGIVTTEFTRIAQLRGDFLHSQVRLEGTEHLDPNKGILLIGAHLGNWEWMAPAFAGFGQKLAEVVRPLDAHTLNTFVDTTRRSGDIITIPKDRAGTQIIQLLRQGYTVGILIDQSPRENAAPVRFFGQPCWGTIGPVMAAARAKVPIHIVTFVRQPDDTYVLAFSPALELVRSGDLHRDMEENCQRCQDAIEVFVRKYPEQWLWAHRRWKPRPRLESEWAARRKRATATTTPPGLRHPLDIEFHRK